MSSAYMNDLLSVRPLNHHSRQDLNLYNSKVNQITFGYKNFTVKAPKMWNSIPTSIKISETYENVQLNIKKIILPWFVFEKCCLKISKADITNNISKMLA